MSSVSRIALAAAFAAGAALAAAPPALAQKNKPAQGQQFQITKPERLALQPLQAAVAVQNWAAAQAALPAAQAAAQGADARYAVARFQFEIGRGTQNVPLQSQAIDAMIASGKVPAADLPALYESQALLAASSGNSEKAERALARLIEISPNNPARLVDLARVKNNRNKPQEAVQLIERAIELRRSTGQPVEESWYQFAYRLASDTKQLPSSARLSRQLLTAYPTRDNWRDALLTYRDLNPGLDAGAKVDLFRLMRATKSLAGERDYSEMAEALQAVGLHGEAKAVLDEGSAARMVDLKKAGFRELHTTSSGRLASLRAGLPALERQANAATDGSAALLAADSFFSFGDYAKAAALYRTALLKGGADANLANMRLGMALALAGNRTEAATALSAVAGSRAELAGYWLTWLGQRA